MTNAEAYERDRAAHSVKSLLEEHSLPSAWADDAINAVVKHRRAHVPFKSAAREAIMQLCRAHAVQVPTLLEHTISRSQLNLLQLVAASEMPITPAQVRYTSKMPYATIKKYLRQLYDWGLLDQPIAFSYAITDSGKTMLTALTAE